MSVDYNTYLGPFVLVHNLPKSSFDEYHACDDKKCTNYHEKSSSKFCDCCGGKIKLVKVSENKPMRFDCYDELNERLAKALSEYKPDEYENYENYQQKILNTLS